jgi:hypothetical protein
MQMNGEGSFLFVALLCRLAETVRCIGVNGLAHLEVGVLSLHFQVVLQLLLDALRGLKAVDQLKLFLLHPKYLLLVHHLLVLLSLKLLFNLSFDPILTLELIQVALLMCFLLLSTDHQLHLLGSRFLGGPILLNSALYSVLFELGLVGLATRVVDSLELFGLGPLFLFFLNVVVLLSLGLLLGLFLLTPKLLLLVHFVVTLALCDDLVCPLSCLLNFLDRLKTS